MIGVLIFAGILGYGIVYSGLGDLQLGKGAVPIREALLGKGKAGPAGPGSFPKPRGPQTARNAAPRTGRQ